MEPDQKRPRRSVFPSLNLLRGRSASGSTICSSSPVLVSRVKNPRTKGSNQPAATAQTDTADFFRHLPGCLPCFAEFSPVNRRRQPVDPVNCLLFRRPKGRFAEVGPRLVGAIHFVFHHVTFTLIKLRGIGRGPKHYMLRFKVSFCNNDAVTDNDVDINLHGGMMVFCRQPQPTLVMWESLLPAYLLTRIF